MTDVRLSDAALSNDVQRLDTLYPGIIEQGWKKRLLVPGLSLLGAVYLVICFFAFGVPGVIEKARGDMAQLFALDAYAHKVHAKYQFKKADQGFVVSLEGNRRSIYKEQPNWIAQSGDQAIIDLGGDGVLRFGDGVVTYTHPSYEQDFVFQVGDGVPQFVSGEEADWLKVSKTQVNARPSLYTRIWLTKSKVEVHRYFVGWENFWFDFDSKLNGLSSGELLSLAFSSDRIDPDVSNIRFMFNEFWTNSEWQHGEVYFALLQTLIMAVVGTLIAGILALPLAFAAAANVNPVRLARTGVRRFFDFLRGVDMLIWSLIFIRAFGLGPLSGIFAIFFTDTGTFGKLFSEAIENADKKQAEGVQATGASPVQKYRFGLFPQILPLFISQMLYYLESNTRSATVIGALGAGGIGLKLIETMRTRQDWENTLYLIFLIIIVVMLMDQLSGWLRRKLIEGQA
ncbi:phosphonate ABC transporter, permease protein PhnE [Pseudovibrio brasiliensis]|uniref:Phosphonate ABC transporter, permease protein PhnE n=1 Tax=Pseudovibrio brasiliensis TaxID=1898042 RepID=A0ABX8AHJ7_9HYPH|nr:phosphonate ABC transporter, permease protein PhnE [Pseudovibrio brasiliensis]QUS54300.1 phosphonate ABC transporter, permease protein PhnE [Pseudovibrio brasiliensis]